MTTFSALLATLLTEPGRPLVTFYDDATGERVELSVATYANWVAKTSSLFVEELDLERGQRLRVDLPTHWLGPVFLGAAWTVGLTVTEDDDPDAVVCGPATLDRWAAQAEKIPVVACALKPLGVRFSEPLPAGVHDFGVEVWTQPDAFTPWDPPTADDPATDDATQAELFAAARDGVLLGDGGRLLTDANPASPDGRGSFTEPLVRRGSAIWVANADPATWQQKYEAERATATSSGR
ncbi:TIGR03089 family protein [Nocardioides speluncae]|uniref:TIGR03089 family protein n=1 Tax=Nocardioides speluncae TaxID=2670337 RepID=UPI000D68DAF9|nr:TIGR03089 family protein [Nocardioides speluncae]